MLSLLARTNALAMDTFFVGARGQAMAGANTVSVNDHTAQYYNPAALGFIQADQEQDPHSMHKMRHKKWSAGLDLGAGIRIQGDLVSYADALSDIDPDILGQGIQDADDVQDLIRLTSNLAGIAEPGNAVTVDFNSGIGANIGNFAIGGRGLFQATGVPELDQERLGFDVDMNQVNTDIEQQVPGDGQVDLFTSEQQQILQNAGFSPGAVENLDFVARQINVQSKHIENMVDLLENVGLTSDTEFRMEKNQSRIYLQGLGLLEVPLSYGYAFNEHFAVGGNLKLMRGRVYINEVLVFDDDAEYFLEDTRDRYQESSTLGLDLGFMVRYNRLAFGFMGRNLNAPKFESPSFNGLEFDDVKLDPQLRAGVAYMPFDSLTLESNLDLTKNETTFQGYDTQYLSLGLEWRPWAILSLRGGMYTNMTESDISEVYTAGFGLQLGRAHLDLAGAMSRDTDKYDEEDFPQEARITAQLGMSF